MKKLIAVGMLISVPVVSLTAVKKAQADYAAAVLADDPLGYWRFNDPPGDVAVNSGSGGTDGDGMYIDVDRDAPGPAEINGMAVIGLGADNRVIRVGDDDPSAVATEWSPLSNLEAFTMSGFVSAGERLNNRIGLWGQNDAPEFGFINPQTIQMWTPGGGALNYDIGQDPAIDDLINDEQWFHLATVGNGDEILLYINGEEVGIGGAPTADYGDGAETFTFKIGGDGVYDATGNQFTGSIDEVAIWDVALTVEQIQGHFAAAFQPAGGGGSAYEQAVQSFQPLGYWRFNDPAGSDSAVNSGTAGTDGDGTYIDVDRDSPGPATVAGRPVLGLGAGNRVIRVGDDDPSAVATEFSPLSNLEQFTMIGFVSAGERLNNRIGLWGQNDAPEFGFINPQTIQMWTPGGGALNYDIGQDPAIDDLINNEEWFHLATVGNGDEILLYINGEEVGIGGAPTADYGDGATTFNFKIGGDGVYDATGNQFTGSIDEVAIWDVALTAEQIVEIFEATFVAGGGAALQAGDADQDLDFDQLDLVQVQIAGKYLSGTAATWGEGDWNGAPGGSPGSPPAGDGRFDQLDIIGALNANVYLTGPYAAVRAGGVEGDGQTSVGYDPSSGQVWVDAPAGVELTSVNIDSAGGIFTGEAAQNLGGSFDNDADGNIFKATFGGSFGTTSFGNVAQSGLSQDFLLNDLTVVGSLAGGGALGDVDLIYVPEPSSIVLAGLAMLALCRIAKTGRR